MAKFLLVTRGGTMPESADEGARVMQAWMDWFTAVGDHMVDSGNPFSMGREVTKTGNRDLPLEPTSLTDAYAAVKVLSQQAGVRYFNVVVNTAPSEGAAKDIFETLTSVTNRFLNARVRYLGHLPRDENMHRAIMAQRPLVDVFPHSPSSRALAVLADKLLNEPAPSPLDGGMKLLWQRLLRESTVRS